MFSCPPRHFAKGRLIFRAAEPADTLFFIQQGRVKISAVSEQGKEAILVLPGPGDFVGEETIIQNHTSYITTATAITDCALIPIEVGELRRLLRDQSRFAELFLSFLLLRNKQLQESLADQLFDHSEKRLAKILLSLSGIEPGEIPKPIIPDITHQTLAEMVGTTRPRISFFLNRFKKLKLIEYKNKQLYIHSSLRNYVLRG
jgi:CRP/FNR family transcriptional regulator, cyclic AMP receptor protein